MRLRHACECKQKTEQPTILLSALPEVSLCGPVPPTPGPKFHHVPSLKLTYPLKICRNPKGPFIFQASIFKSKTGIFKSKRYFQNQYPSYIPFIFFAYYPSEEHFSGPNAKTVFPRLKPDMQKPPLSLCQNIC